MLKRATATNPLKLARFTSCLILLVSMVDCGGVDHCYSDLGCFPLSEQFYHPRHRPFNVRPWHRSRIRTQFEIYNPKHPQGFMLTPWDRKNLIISGFDQKLETKIIIPGWLDNIKRTVWFKRMKDAFQYYWHPVNVIVVHWRNFTPYTIATANTRVVGAELANLIKFLEHEMNYNRAYYHLIGHSLGAHIGGYCGDRLPGLGRITALDPARPFFQHMPKSVRLDRGDAKFVDAIHSDFTPENAIFLLMSFGMTTPVGHVDFYPNGPPLLQPGCLRDTLLSVRNGIQRGLEHSSLSVAFLEAIRYLTACDHQRSHEWFTESILNRQCVFVGVRCNEFEGMINGRCTCDDSPSSCAIMGIHADQMYMNGVHDDLWPLGRGRTGSPVRAQPLPRPRWNIRKSSAQEQSIYNVESYRKLFEMPLARPKILDRSKDQVNGYLKHSSDRLRQPGDLAPIVEEFQHDHLDKIQDALFVEYLKFNLFLKSPSFQGNFKDPHQKTVLGPLEMSPGMELIANTVDEIEPLFQDQAKFPFNQHPKLISDFDRDVDEWYENTSRWYLKTNSKPNYCVNQYQVLVYLGPLRSTGGKQKLRANLLISIIGSRGQLVNQRFKPRSSQLDSFTMQPFFILLEGSYSLGDILSVAIGWEARHDPDPIQATISFQSNLLENMEASWPLSYKAKHPWLSETLKYDHSQGFRWNNRQVSPILLGSEGFHSDLLSEVGVQLDRRQGLDLVEDLDLAATGGCSIDAGADGRSNQNRRCSSESIRSFSKDDLLSEDELMKVINYMESSDVPHNLLLQDHYRKAYGIHQQVIPPLIREHNTQRSTILSDLDPLQGAAAQVTAEFHNVDFLDGIDVEDTIIINEVLVSPLQATYGKLGGRTGKTFCPPHREFSLRKDQTVRLVPNILGKCHQHGYNFQNRRPNRPQQILTPLQSRPIKIV